MTDPQSLLETPESRETPEPEDAPEPAGGAPAPEPTAPDYLPPKFWDAEAGAVRVEDLARSYAALERRLGSAGGDTVPDDPAGYRIEPAMEGLAPDPEVNTRLMEAGFTQAQAQLVYDLAAEKLAPWSGIWPPRRCGANSAAAWPNTSAGRSAGRRRRARSKPGAAPTWRPPCSTP